MNIFKNRKKSGFTLMEVAIAVMIVGLLTVICIPVVQRQLEKSDEYAYYMAYRSVEKLGGQIVALGDPEDAYYNTSISNGIKLALDKKTPFQTLKNKITVTFSSLGTRFAYTEKYLFKNLFPNSLAEEEDWIEYGNGEDGTYQNVNYAYRVCKGGETIREPEPSGTDSAGNPTYNNYSCSDLVSDEEEEFKDYALVRGLLPPQGCFINSTTAEENARLAELETFIKNDKSTDGNLEGFCRKINTPSFCATTDSSTGIKYKVEPDSIIEHDDEDNQDYTTHYCRYYSYTPDGGGSSDSNSGVTLERRPVPDTCTPAYGYYGMVNAADKDTDGKQYALSCECRMNRYATQNNDKVCCPQLSGANTYARANLTNTLSEGPLALNQYSGYCVHCLGDYNSVGNWCCPEHSVFNGSECQCVEGYEMDSATKGTSNERCVKTKCAPGSHLDTETEVCVPNPPLLKADRFCNLINKYWNTAARSCNTFSKVDGANVYNKVLEAAKGANGGAYLSIRSKDGSFNDPSMPPNIVLTNGLKLWILGDKAASVPGLSYNPVGITNTQNICREVLSGAGDPLSTKAKCEGKGYFCKGEAHCYTLDAQSLLKMGDARNCCVAADISDLPPNSEKDNRAFAISGFTVFVDINGDKGSGTLWEDVFPFFVGANGKVYPGYPLDAPKDENSSSTGLYLGGNSVKNLPVDVYYYDNDARSDNARKKIVVWSNVSYARGLCLGKIINPHTPYCQNLGLKFKQIGTGSRNKSKIIDEINNPANICNEKNCFINVRNKLRFF